MKLKDLLKSFGGGVCVSVYDDSKDYCKEAAYDYYDLPKWARSKADGGKDPGYGDELRWIQKKDRLMAVVVDKPARGGKA